MIEALEGGILGKYYGRQRKWTRRGVKAVSRRAEEVTNEEAEVRGRGGSREEKGWCSSEERFMYQ